jgi:DNA-binding transcriptional regulator YhcF (GntR family)
MDEKPLVRVDRDVATPPFEQVRTQLAAQVASGALAPGTRLPPVRALAEELGLAANTVARVYKELEADGVVETRGRNGTVVRSGPAAHAADATKAADELVATCRRLGLGLPDAVLLVEDRWSRHHP